MLPVLRAAKQAEVRIGDVIVNLASDLGLSEAARNALLASGRQTIFANRVHWAKTYLAKAGLVETTRRSEEHTSELQSLMRISYAVFCLKNKQNHKTQKKT